MLVGISFVAISYTVIYIRYITNVRKIENTLDQLEGSEDELSKEDQLQVEVLTHQQLQKISFNQSVLFILLTITLILMGILYLLHTIVDNFALL